MGRKEAYGKFNRECKDYNFYTLNALEYEDLISEFHKAKAALSMHLYKIPKLKFENILTFG